MTHQSIGYLAEYLITHRKGNAFKGNSLEDIIASLEEDAKNSNLLYVFDDEDCKFHGFISFLKDNTHKILYIKNLVITKHSALVVFIRYFRMRFDGYSICANRPDGYIEYNTNRLLHLLEIKSH